VDQKNADRSALMGAIRVVRHGGAVLIFPEGTRSADGELQPARPGLGMIAAKTGAPVVPVHLAGSFAAFPKGAKFPKAAPVEVRIGRPLILPQGSGGERSDYDFISRKALLAIATLRAVAEKTTATA
jgi:1-acyl-sn-glycerol-3-phosphate acyltransferase